MNERDILAIGPGREPTGSAEEFGFKAWNLARMARAGLPVPPAFVLGTAFCREYFRRGRKPPAHLGDILAARMRELERATSLGFGSHRRPLLVSVRSGGAVSMPGMLETVLDVGLCEATVPGLLRLTGNPRLVWDSYRRLVQSFAQAVHGAPARPFDAALDARMREAGVASAADLDFDSLRSLARDFLDIHESVTGTSFPQQPLQQLEGAIAAVWSSWEGEKATHYRKMQRIRDDAGTAVTVQRMVYGNAGGTSGAGVAFTRDPSTGEDRLYLDFAFNAQGEDVVSGRQVSSDGERLAAVMPGVHAEIVAVAGKLEAEFGDMQEFEFTVQDASLFILQTRTGKRTPWAALRIAVDLAEANRITPQVALDRLAGIDLDAVRRARIVPNDGEGPACSGVGASMGVASGEIALDSARAVAAAAHGVPSILVREATSTEDIAGFQAAAGILTAAGNRTSHAAVVARQLDKPCVVGCAQLTVDVEKRRCALGGRWLDEGEQVSIDGETGQVFAARVGLAFDRPLAQLAKVAEWKSGAS